MAGSLAWLGSGVAYLAKSGAKLNSLVVSGGKFISQFT